MDEQAWQGGSEAAGRGAGGAGGPRAGAGSRRHDVRAGHANAAGGWADRRAGRAAPVELSRWVQHCLAAAHYRADELGAAAQPGRAVRWHSALDTYTTESYERRVNQPPSASCQWWASTTRKVGTSAGRGLMRMRVCVVRSTTRPKGCRMVRRASLRCSLVAWSQ